MKILGNEIKPGMIIEHKNDLWSVLKAQHVKPGKGGAFNQVELKSIKRGTKLNERFRSSDTTERAILEDRKFNFLYEDESNCHFMDQTNFEQIQINKKLIFKHGKKYYLPDGKILFSSYHPSPRNVNTGLLNKTKMKKILISIKKLL